MFNEDAMRRFREGYTVAASGCWLWKRGLQTSGYGQISVDGRRWVSHRFAYRALVGPIPSGMVLDHIRHVRHCVNPSHLQVVSNKQNCENLTLAKTNRSGVRGVSWDSRTSTWIAAVKHQRVSHHVGRFRSIDEAKAAVVAARNRLFTNNLADRA